MSLEVSQKIKEFQRVPAYQISEAFQRTLEDIRISGDFRGLLDTFQEDSGTFKGLEGLIIQGVQWGFRGIFLGVSAKFRTIF